MTTWYRIQAGNKPQNIKSRRAGIDAGSSFLYHIYVVGIVPMTLF